jgi:hypothetical protein
VQQCRQTSTFNAAASDWCSLCAFDLCCCGCLLLAFAVWCAAGCSNMRGRI